MQLLLSHELQVPGATCLSGTVLRSHMEERFAWAVKAGHAVSVLACEPTGLERIERRHPGNLPAVLGHLALSLGPAFQASEAAVCLADERLLVLLVGPDPARIEEACKDWIGAARELPVEGLDEPQRIDLSIGLGVTQPGKRLFLDTLIQVALEGLEVARYRGAGACVHTMLYDILQHQLERDRESEGVAVTANAPLEAVTDNRPEAPLVSEARTAPQAPQPVTEATPAPVAPAVAGESAPAPAPEVVAQPASASLPTDTPTADAPAANDIAPAPAASAPQAPAAARTAQPAPAPPTPEVRETQQEPRTTPTPVQTPNSASLPLAPPVNGSSALQPDAAAAAPVRELTEKERRQQALLLALRSQKQENQELRSQLQQLANRQPEAPQAPASGEGTNPGDKRRIDQLQRRIGKLMRSLEETEARLAQVSQMKAVDNGVSSCYRTVQGIDADDPDRALKADLMSKILEANLELRNRIQAAQPYPPPAPKPVVQQPAPAPAPRRAPTPVQPQAQAQAIESEEMHEPSFQAPDAFSNPSNDDELEFERWT